ncbi:MAG: metallophosphoesterase [Candidatus Electrothrix sp. AW5]|nr:metallophosphoesterase [Candidatus Electrothrix gigas]
MYTNPFSKRTTMTDIIRAGILSDTHLTRPSQDFITAAQQCFANCEVIIHAGDLTDISVLDIFSDKTVYAVHGNCCGRTSHASLPQEQRFQLGNFTIGLLHGYTLGRYADTIEAGIWDVFPEADCVIYGHTHEPVCKRIAGKLLINPGAFQVNNWYSGPCPYVILEAGQELKGEICKY